jgi:hypothetical protein
MWRLIATAVLATWVLCASAPAAAQGNAAKEHYMQGVALFEAGNYKAALAEFLESYQARPNWKLRHTIAICYFNLNRFVAAKNELDMYLAEGGKNVPADKKAEVEEMVLQIAKLTAEVKIEVNVDGATIWIDDEKMATSPMGKPLFLDSGLYLLEITAPGYVKYKRDLKLVGGDKKVYDISLESKGGGAVVTPPPDKKPEKKPEKKPKKKKKKEKKPKGPKKPLTKEQKTAIGILAGGGAAAALGLGGLGATVAFGLEVNKNKEEFDACEGNFEGNPGLIEQCQDHYRSEGEKAKTLTNAMAAVGSVFLAAGAALIVVGAIKMKKAKGSTEKPPDKTSFAITPLITGDSVYLGVAGTF